MNYNPASHAPQVPDFQVDHFQELIGKLYQCCQERIKYQSERFDLPDAELRCLMIFGEERYLTAKGISLKMNIVKSRVTKILGGLESKGLIKGVKDPEDSRITLLSLTAEGQKKFNDINGFMMDIHRQVLMQMEPEQRKIMLTNLDMLKASLESVKDSMV